MPNHHHQAEAWSSQCPMIKNVHHVDPHNPYRVPPLASKAKQSPTASPFLRTKSVLGRAVVPFLGTKFLLAMAANCMASNTCLACEVPNRYMVHCHKFYPESHVDVLCDILGEYDFLQETVFDMSGYMLHEANLSSDSGYHSPPRTVTVHLDVSSGTMVPGSVLCEDTGHPEVKMPGLMLPSASTPRVNGENTANAASMSASFGQSETFIEPNSSISGNSIVHPIEEKVLPSPIEFPAQRMTASHPIGVDEDLEDYVCQAPTYVQHTSTHDPAITSPDGPLNCPRLVLMAKGQPQ